MRSHWAFALCWLAVSTPAFAASPGSDAAVDGDTAPGHLNAAASLEIDRIEVTGVTVVPNAEIEGALEIAPGDRPERFKVARSAENLEKIYRSRGYEQMKIRTRLSRKRDERDAKTETVLEFEITEGAPTRVARVGIVSDGAREKSSWPAIREALLAKFKLEPGAVFDQERLNSSKRDIQDALASEEFIGARITETRVTEAAAPGGLTPLPSPTARWVNLEFHVDLGDRVTFGFRGNTVFTSVKLAGLVDDLRAVGFGKDYIGAISARIEDEYHSLGYAHIKATPYIIEEPEHQERHVTYVLDEGPRVDIDSITFDGNVVFSSDELRTRFYAAAADVIKRGYYVDKEVRRAAAAVTDWMKSDGYLNAKLVTITPRYPPKPKRITPGGSVALVIYLYEGDQTTVRKVSVEGARFLDGHKINALLGVSDGQPLNLFAFNQGIEALKTEYRNAGYLDVQVSNPTGTQVVTYTQDGQQADIRLEVAEGPQYRVSRVQLEGLQQTRDEVVRRELAFKEGDVLGEQRLRESEANLRKLGIFANVVLRASDDPEKSGYKIIRISLDEGTPNLIAGGVGFRNDLGVRVFGQTAFSNLWGRDHTLSLDLAANHRIEVPFLEYQGQIPFQFVEYQGQLAYLWPWFFGVEGLNFRPSVTISQTQYSNFDATSISLAAAVEKKLLKSPNLTGVLTYKLEHVDQFDVQEDPSIASLDNINIIVGSITPELRLDLRDRPLAPTSGFFASVSNQIASPLLLSQGDPLPIAFTKFQTRMDYLLPIASEITWFFSARTGWEKSLEPALTTHDASGTVTGANGIPLIDQFVLGGEGSLRGFPEQSLNAYGTEIYGTLSYVNFRTQLDLPFAGALRFGPFLDAANISVDSYWAGPLRIGVGFGFHYQTPVGPVNLDWGFNPYPNLGEESNQVYFSIGLI